MITEAPATTFETAEKLGLSKEEFTNIKTILGRVPNFTELSIFSVMWSEHCSYKNSIHWLKTLPRDGKRMLVEAGEENAGLVDIGDGLACAFKIESHNHPSAIEPYQGAATGVGGIHRDIFTMGARPVAALNSLRFGRPDHEKTRHLLKGVVKGIGDYGNAFGVPTVGGELYFEPCYQVNPLVNAMSVGVVDTHKTVSAISEGVGNPVYIVGSSTGKDGIHGATFASEDISEDSADKLPAVQVGDPFQEKLLLEATLEAIETGAIVGMQDMGAAGITCSTSEMSAKGKHGMTIDLDKVPTRQPNMQAFEILLSESQERMLVVVRKGQEAAIEKVFDKWDLQCAVIGEVTDTGDVEFYMSGECVARVPAEPLVLGGGAPVYQREYEKPAYTGNLEKFRLDTVELPSDWPGAAMKVVQQPNIASKKWVYQQYDSMVGTNNVSTNKPSDAAVIRIKDHQKSLLATVDCNSRYVYADPYRGAAMAVAEAARNIVCSGGEPVAITNCLNFGNPYNKGVYWQFVHVIKGMGEACRKFDTPVTGGNVSFYNQSSDEGPVFPTPVIGMLGILEDPAFHMTLDLKASGDLVYLIGQSHDDLGASVYLTQVLGVDASPAPVFDLDEEYQMQQALSALIKDQLIRSAHDISEGGLFIALLESAMAGDRGFDLTTDPSYRKDAFLFGESAGRVVVSIRPEHQQQAEALMAAQNVPFMPIGKVTDTDILIDRESFGKINTWSAKYNEALESYLA